MNPLNSNTTPVQSISAATPYADDFHVAQGYFSDILQTETAIFTTIVTVVIALSFLFNWRASRTQIKKESDAHFLELKEQMERGLNEKMENLENIFSTSTVQQKIQIGKLSGQNFRTLGHFWDSQKNYGIAFIWWFRAAHQFVSTSDETLARICLSGAKESIEKVKYGFELQSDYVGEYQKLSLEIPDTYKIEKEMLDTAIKSALLRKIPVVTPTT